MILVTAATGTVGSALVASLCARGEGVRALVRSPERADALRGYDCEVVVGDLADPPSLRPAVAGVRAIFLASPSDARQAELEGNVVAAAAAAGRPAVVKLAAAGFDGGKIGRIGGQHAASLARLAEAGLPSVVLAPYPFFQNLTRAVADLQERGVLALPAGDAAVASVDARDVADAAAGVLTDVEAHVGSSYELSGPAALSFAERAAALSAVVGRDIRYVDVEPATHRRDLLAAGLDEWHADALGELYAAYRAGYAATVTDTVERLTGRPPRSLPDYLDEHRAAFALR